MNCHGIYSVHEAMSVASSIRPSILESLGRFPGLPTYAPAVCSRANRHSVWSTMAHRQIQPPTTAPTGAMAISLHNDPLFHLLSASSRP